jgi:hypothetical protein
VKRQKGDAHICLEASYWCGLVGPRDGYEAAVFNLLPLPPVEKMALKGVPTKQGSQL